MIPPLFIFAGGGTGGHLYPGLAVADELRRLLGEVKVVFACSNRAIDRRILDGLDYAVVPQPVRPLPRNPLQVVPFLAAWLKSRRQARDMIADLKPAAVLGLGGFAAGPVVCRAWRSGVPTALLNPDVVPGKANLYLARFADVIFAQFADSVERFPARVRDKVRPVGCPVRSSLLDGRREEAVRHFDLQADRRTLVVLGGSLGAANINDALALLMDELEHLADRWQVLHITGSAKAGPAGAAAKPRAIRVRTMEYCHEMALAYAAADLVLARAGAGTVAELSATARPGVLMPYPYHKDQHQRLNAASLARAGAAVICDDLKDAAANADRLRQTLLPLLRDEAKLEAMRRAAAGASRPHAARDVAQWLAMYAGVQKVVTGQ